MVCSGQGWGCATCDAAFEGRVYSYKVVVGGEGKGACAEAVLGRRRGAFM